MRLRLLTALCGILCYTSLASQAAILLALDIESDTRNGSPAWDGTTQAGFQSFRYTASGAPTNTYSGITDVVSGAITVTFNNPSTGARYRTGPTGDTAAFTYSALYRDLYVGFQSEAAPNSANNVVTFSGLDPNTTYGVTFYSYTRDYDNGAIYSWYDNTSGSSAWLGSTPQNTGSTNPTSNDQFAVYGTFTTNASGVANFGFTALNLAGAGVGSGAINALIIHTVPEPGRALLSLGAIGVTLCLRRRKLQH